MNRKVKNETYCVVLALLIFSACRNKGRDRTKLDRVCIYATVSRGKVRLRVYSYLFELENEAIAKFALIATIGEKFVDLYVTQKI